MFLGQTIFFLQSLLQIIIWSSWPPRPDFQVWACLLNKQFSCFNLYYKSSFWSSRPPRQDFQVLGMSLEQAIFFLQSLLQIMILEVLASKTRFPSSGHVSWTSHFLLTILISNHDFGGLGLQDQICKFWACLLDKKKSKRTIK